MNIVLIGVNHRTASIGLRERLAFSPEQARRAGAGLLAQEILQEAVVLSTCNRSEVYGVARGEAPDPHALLEDFVTQFHGIAPTELDGNLYREADASAVRHLFRVAAGLDSMLLGEAEILGQVREAYRLAFEAGTTGPVLNRLFQSALEAGKRVRAETDLGSRPVSVAAAAVKLAEKIFGKMQGHTALIVGAGKAGEQVAESLRDRGIGRLLIANRTRQRGEDLAGRVGGTVVEWGSLSAVLEEPDILVSSLGGPEPAITRESLSRAMAARAGRAMFVIDLGVPRNIEPSVAELYNVYLYNIDELSEIVEQNRKAREAEIPRAEAIVAEHAEKFDSRQASLRAVAVIDQLREKLQTQREDFLRERLDRMNHLSAQERAHLAELTQELLDRILEEPADRLRHSKELRRKLQESEALRELFGLAKGKP